MINRAEILDQLLEFLKSDTEAPIEKLTENLSLREELGLDSVDLVGIIMRIEGHYRIRLTHAELEQVASVGSLLDLIERKLGEEAPVAVQNKAA